MAPLSWIQLLLSTLVLVAVLLANFLAISAIAVQQERAEGLRPPQRPGPQSLLESARQYCLPLVTLRGLLESTVVVVIAFGLMCDALYRAGLSSWFENLLSPGEEPSLGQWLWFSLLQALRAADLPDLLDKYALEDFGLSMPDWLRPIRGRSVVVGVLLRLFRFAIGALLLSQALAMWLRGRRLRKAVLALGDPETRPNAARTLICNGWAALAPLRHVLQRHLEPEHSAWVLACLNLCEQMGADAASLEPDIRAVFAGAADADKLELRWGAIRALSTVSADLPWLASTIHQLWFEAMKSPNPERILIWKGTLAPVAVTCTRRALQASPEELSQIRASLRGATSEPARWLLWHLDRTNPRAWPLVVPRPAGFVEIAPASLRPEESLRPAEIAVEPLADTTAVRQQVGELVDRYIQLVALPRQVTLTLPGGARLRFALVPAGAYWRGNNHGPGDGDDNELPVHPVLLRAPFYLQDSAATLAQFGAFLQAATDVPPQLHSMWASLRRHHQGDDHPMVFVPYGVARAYCRWLGEVCGGAISQQLGSSVSGVEVTLPTEAEWEWAAKGPAQWKYPWGNAFDGKQLQAGLDPPTDQDLPQTVPVYQFPGGASWCGLTDMAGNAFVWCDDMGVDYHTLPVDRFSVDPVGVTTEVARVQRGGAWRFTGWDARTSYRYLTKDENSSVNELGFRVALGFGRPQAI